MTERIILRIALSMHSSAMQMSLLKMNRQYHSINCNDSLRCIKPLSPHFHRTIKCTTFNRHLWRLKTMTIASSILFQATKRPVNSHLSRRPEGRWLNLHLTMISLNKSQSTSLNASKLCGRKWIKKRRSWQESMECLGLIRPPEGSTEASSGSALNVSVSAYQSKRLISALRYSISLDRDILLSLTSLELANRCKVMK